MTLPLMIVVGVYALLLIGAGLSLCGWLQVRSFLRSHDALRSRSEFDEFKRVVKTNMFLALAILVAFGLVLILGAIGLFIGAIGFTDVLIVLVILGPICAFAGVKMTAVEKRMKAITVENEKLRREFDHVVNRWTSSALPDW